MAEGGLANIGGRGSRRGPARVRGRDGGQHFAGAPVCLVETRGAGACERAAQLGSERHLASEHERGRDGPMPGGRRVDHGGGLRGLPEAGVGTVASAGAGSSDGQPFFSQRFLGTRAHRRERLRAHVSATLFARSQSHRGSVRKAQGAATESRGTYPRGAHRGDGPSSRRGDGERCSRLLRASRLPREGPSAMTDALGEGGVEGAQRRHIGETDFELLSIPDVCQQLGMGKSWVYRRLKSGEIPSIKLGHNIKVKRQDLEQYLESQRYQPSRSEED